MARRVAQAGVKETMAYLDKLNTQTTAELRTEAQTARVEDTKFVLAMTMAVSVTVLCRDIGWRGLDGTEKDYRCRLSNYMAYLQDELDRVFEDKDFTLKKYMDNVYEKYGVKCEYGGDHD
jgi:hypothetical protein